MAIIQPLSPLDVAMIAHAPVSEHGNISAYIDTMGLLKQNKRVSHSERTGQTTQSNLLSGTAMDSTSLKSINSRCE